MVLSAPLALRDPTTVFNLEVAGTHTYLVGEAGVLVHNRGNGCAASGGETPAARKGRQEHKNWDPGPGFEKEVTLPSGKRADAVNKETKTVKELKPDNPKAIKRGETQVEGYRKELEQEYPGEWTGIVETHKR